MVGGPAPAGGVDAAAAVEGDEERHQTEEGEARRDDDSYAYGAVWEYTRDGSAPVLHKEPLTFEHVPLTQRSYK